MEEEGEVLVRLGHVLFSIWDGTRKTYLDILEGERTLELLVAVKGRRDFDLNNARWQAEVIITKRCGLTGRAKGVLTPRTSTLL